MTFHMDSMEWVPPLTSLWLVQGAWNPWHLLCSSTVSVNQSPPAYLFPLPVPRDALIKFKSFACQIALPRALKLETWPMPAGSSHWPSRSRGDGLHSDYGFDFLPAGRSLLQLLSPPRQALTLINWAATFQPLSCSAYQHTFLPETLSRTLPPLALLPPRMLLLLRCSHLPDPTLEGRRPQSSALLSPLSARPHFYFYTKVSIYSSSSNSSFI